MTPAQRTALAIYLACMSMLLAMVFFLIAPLLAKAAGLGLPSTARVLLALTALAGGWTAVSIVRAPDPLGRLGRILSARPNSGSQWTRREAATTPAREVGEAVPAAPAGPGRKEIVPR